MCKKIKKCRKSVDNYTIMCYYCVEQKVNVYNYTAVVDMMQVASISIKEREGI